MDTLRVLGSVAVVLVAVGLGGVLASLVTENALVGSGDGRATPAIVTLLTFVVALFACIAIVRSRTSSRSTPYW